MSYGHIKEASRLPGLPRRQVPAPRVCPPWAPAPPRENQAWLELGGRRETQVPPWWGGGGGTWVQVAGPLLCLLCPGQAAGTSVSVFWPVERRSLPLLRECGGAGQMRKTKQGPRAGQPGGSGSPLERQRGGWASGRRAVQLKMGVQSGRGMLGLPGAPRLVRTAAEAATVGTASRDQVTRRGGAMTSSLCCPPVTARP